MRTITTKAIALLITFSVATFAQQKGSFTDSRDKKTYKTVKIGNQTWMAENLNYSGSDGYLGLCYGKKPENCQKYGRLYDWSEAMGIDRKFNGESYTSKNAKHQGICPAGWHLPTKNEWNALIVLAGGNEIAGTKLKAKEGWMDIKCKWTEEKEDDRGRKSKTEYDYCSTDEFGFSALPGGVGGVNGSFGSVGLTGFWWTASELADWSTRASLRGMSYDIADVANEADRKGNLLSVRCLQD